MNKKCGKCAKTVYPTEELKCLDKSWHKGCFRCWECGMALNMRTYKGFNKLPYCEAHIPKPKATTVADTPEMARIAENTKLQSNVKYHADFEAAKGKFTTVADDPETLRIRTNTKNISNVAYHGDLERKAAMDQQRLLSGENDDPESPPAHKVVYLWPQQQMSGAPQQRIGSIHEYDPLNEQHGSAAGGRHQYQPAPHQQPPPQQHANYHPPPQHHQYQQYRQPQQQQPYQQQQPPPPQQYGGYQQQQPPPQQYGGYRDQGYRSQQVYRTEGGGAAPYPQQPQQQQQQPPQHHHQPAPQPAASGRCCRALYDYEAADHDEISFRDGDILIACQPIDDGWMTGTCQRTGRRGMLPANYVEPIDL